MPAEVLDAPPPSAHDVFKSVETFETPTPKVTTPPPPIGKPEGDEPPPLLGQQKVEGGTEKGPELIDKPDAMKTAAEKKTALEKLGQVKKPEAAGKADAEKGRVGDAEIEKPLPENTPAKLLREAYEKRGVDMAALRAELDKVRPDAEKLVGLRAELEGSREELAKLKAMNLNDDERKEYGSLREQHALDVLRSSPEFHQKFIAPIHQQTAKIDGAAKQAGLNPAATEALLKAMDITDEFARDTEIEKIFTEAELAPNIFNRCFNAMSAVGRELNEKLYPAMEAKEKEAFGIQQAARARDKQQVETKSAAEKAEFQKEHDYVHKVLSEDSLKPLMEDTDLAIEGVTLAEAMKGAEAAENARDRAYQAHAGAALPFVIQYTNKLLEKIHALEQANKIRNGAGTSRSDAVVKTVNGAPETLTAQEVFGGRGSMGPSMVR